LAVSVGREPRIQTTKRGKKLLLTVFVVVTHLRSGVRRSVTGSVNGLFGDLHVLVVDGARSRGVEGSLGDVGGGLLEDGAVARAVYCGGVDVDALLVNGAVAGAVNGRTGGADFFAVVGLEARAVFTLGDVDDGVVGAVSAIDLNAGLDDRRLGSGGAC
jgi:hypothetical protein